MRRLMGLVILATFAALGGGVLTASPAGAVPPDRTTFEVHDTTDYPAGEICDFDLRLTLDFSIADTIFFDQSGNPVRDFFTINGVITATNLDTGLTLTAVNHRANTFDIQNGGQVTRGLYLQLRTPDGTLIAVLSGKLVFGPNGITGTPHIGPAFPVICSALGGSSV